MNQQQLIDRQRFQRIHNADYLMAEVSPPVRELLDALVLDVDSVVVEFGAGQGHFTLPIAQRLEMSSGRGLVFAFDYAPKMIESLDEAAVELALDNRIRAWPLAMPPAPLSLPVADGKADRVLAVNTLQYLEDPVPICAELDRILAPDGFLLFADWSGPVDKLNRSTLPVIPPPEKVLDLLADFGLDEYKRVSLHGFSWAFCVRRFGSGAVL